MDKSMRASQFAKKPRRHFLAGSLRGALLVAGVLALFGAALWGCGSATHLVAQRAEVFTPGAARVVLMSVDDAIITIDVFNQTPYPMVIYRDALMLSTRAGGRARLPGGVGHVYSVRPGGVQTVKVRYPINGLHRGDQVALVFENALLVNGQPLPIEPLPFLVE